MLVNQDILMWKDVFNQLIVLYNSILYVLQEIENSVTFCQLNTLHTSIITKNELLMEIRKTFNNNKRIVPFDIEYTNLLHFESLIKVHCKIQTEQIIYFLTIPTNFDEHFTLYRLYSVPFKHESEFVTIYPRFNYLLKGSNNTFTPLNNICPRGKVFHCPSRDINHEDVSCEKEVFNAEIRSCKYTKLEIPESYTHWIPEINQYIGVFPKEEIIDIICPDRREKKSIFGVFLIKLSDCNVSINEQQLYKKYESFGTPLVITNWKPKITRQNLSNFTIKIRPLHFGKIEMGSITPIDSPMALNHLPSVWTIILYVGIAICIGYFIQRKFWKSKNRPMHSTTADLGPIQLPGGATF